MEVKEVLFSRNFHLVCGGVFLGDCPWVLCIISPVFVKSMGRCSYTVTRSKANGNTGWQRWEVSLTVPLHLFFIKMWTEVLKCGSFLLRRGLPGALLPVLPSVVELAAGFHSCTGSLGRFLLKVAVKKLSTHVHSWPQTRLCYFLWLRCGSES